MSPRRAPRGAQGPQKGAQRAAKNRSAQKYRKIQCFILENRVFLRFGCIFEATSSAKSLFFGFPRAKTPYFTRPRGAKTAKNPKIHVFARRAVLQDVSRFLGGRGLAKSRKIAFSRGRCCKNTKIVNFQYSAPPRPQKQLYG